MDSTTIIEELNLSVRALNCLKRVNINTIGDIISLLNESGVDGLSKVRNLGRKSTEEVLSVLQSYGFDSKEGVINAYFQDKDIGEPKPRENVPVLSKDVIRSNRLMNNRFLKITIDDPKYARFTRIGAGLALYVTLFNKTGGLIKVKYKNIMLFHDGRQWCADSDYTGYIFKVENIMPDSAKTLGKIWGNSDWKEKQLVNNDYIELTLEYLGKEHAFKLVYNGDKFELNDYFEYSLESVKP